MKTCHIITIGCQMNKSDSERVVGYLENLGYKLIDNKYQADLVVINTCGVRQSAEDRIYGIIPRIKKQNPKGKIILTGCLSKRKDVQRRLKDKVDLWLSIVDLPKLSQALCVMSYELCESDYLKLQPKYSSNFSAFVPIGNGCNNFCSYCVVPDARGREAYRPVENILNEARDLVKKGYKEIVLIAQNVNSYDSLFTPKNAKKRQSINFSRLLKMINNIPGNFWIRFSTSHPKDMSDELIKTIAECDRVCEHIHLPAQSGDNEILKAMNRNYTVEHYKKLIKKIRQTMPEVSITTDIIIGFPGETKKQFNNTVKLFKEVKFDMAYISQYSPRPGTAAEKLINNVPKAEKKRREEELMKVLRKTALENNKEYINKVVEVLVEDKNKKGELFGKTRTSKSVKVRSNLPAGKAGKSEVRSDKKIIGGFARVKIKKAKDFGLEGKIV